MQTNAIDRRDLNGTTDNTAISWISQWSLSYKERISLKVE